MLKATLSRKKSYILLHMQFAGLKLHWLMIAEGLIILASIVEVIENEVGVSQAVDSQIPHQSLKLAPDRLL